MFQLFKKEEREKDVKGEMVEETDDLTEVKGKEKKDYLSNSAAGVVVSKNMIMKNQRGFSERFSYFWALLIKISSFCKFRRRYEDSVKSNGETRTREKKERFS